MKKLKVSGWNDGKQNINGNGYGIRVGKIGREYFNKNKTKIELSIENSEFIDIKITDSFWQNCTEFRDKRIGKWMIENKLAPWEKGKNPKFDLFIVESDKFVLKRQNKI